ncbi:MAG: type I 3-dehydroquinate dehydratase [Chloroflexota bacterium]
MNKPRICGVIVSEDLAAAKRAEPLVDLFEVRIDLVGKGWRGLVKELGRPWLACNRLPAEGGVWKGSEPERVAELVAAAEMGAEIVDIELATSNLAEAVSRVKKKAKCLLSYHNFSVTPPPDGLREIVSRQLAAGADICKVVTAASKLADNIAVLQLIAEFPQARVVSFAMGAQGVLSRVLSPLVGGYFTYASIESGRESASGQMTAADLRKVYGLLNDGG